MNIYIYIYIYISWLAFGNCPPFPLCIVRSLPSPFSSLSPTSLDASSLPFPFLSFPFISHFLLPPTVTPILPRENGKVMPREWETCKGEKKKNKRRRRRRRRNRWGSGHRCLRGKFLAFSLYFHVTHC
jgi:hypothetical protein